MTTLADLLERLGGISPDRVLLRPPPGTATVADVIALDAHEDRLCELVQGTLVEKAGSLRKSLLSGALSTHLRHNVIIRNSGLVTGANGPMQLKDGLVRIPDVAYISWGRLPDRRISTEPVPLLAPDLAVDVLSANNSSTEMALKRREYFQAGVRLVWQVDPEARTVEVFTAPDRSTLLHEAEPLDGGSVLPGFALPLRELFAELDRQGNGA